MKKLFNNCNYYDDNKYTDHIPDEARSDLRDAWRYARDIGCPMNFSIDIGFDISVTESKQIRLQRSFAHKIRVFAKGHSFPARQMIHRSCDPITKANPRIQILFHVPLGKEAIFKKTVSKWKFVKSITAVSCDEIKLSDGTISSAFNNTFAALSPGLSAKHPELPNNPSGSVLGDRTFYSRNMWYKIRLAFWKSKSKNKKVK